MKSINTMELDAYRMTKQGKDYQEIEHYLLNKYADLLTGMGYEVNPVDDDCYDFVCGIVMDAEEKLGR